MGDLARQHCRNHPEREAVVRCPACRIDFCRECVTEHGGRFLCSACLRALTAASKQSARGRRFPSTALLALAGFLTAWLFLYAAVQFVILESRTGRLERPWHAR